MLHLKNMVKTLEERNTTSDQNSGATPCRLWIDTICCPGSPEEDKNLSILQKRRVYQNAPHVLVLDADLQIYSYDEIGPAEALVGPPHQGG
jgi:hypothetical protein